MNFDRYSIPTKKIKIRPKKKCPKCGNTYSSAAKRDKHTTDGSCRMHNKGNMT